MTDTEPRRVVVYKDGAAEGTNDLAVGERVALFRGDGPREGEFMTYATVTQNDTEGFSISVSDEDAAHADTAIPTN
jgi:hypothetical protein